MQQTHDALAYPTMNHPLVKLQLPLADELFLDPWIWINKWKISPSDAVMLLAIEDSNSIYRWYPYGGKQRRQPSKQIKRLCYLYDALWTDQGCPFSREQLSKVS